MFAVKFSDFEVELRQRFSSVFINDRRVVLPCDDEEWMTQTTFKYNIEAYRIHDTLLPEYYLNFNACIECQYLMGPDNPRQLCCKTYCGNKSY
jgi:hypothetical protein